MARRKKVKVEQYKTEVSLYDFAVSRMSESLDLELSFAKMKGCGYENVFKLIRGCEKTLQEFKDKLKGLGIEDVEQQNQ